MRRVYWPTYLLRLGYSEFIRIIYFTYNYQFNYLSGASFNLYLVIFFAGRFSRDIWVNPGGGFVEMRVTR